MNFYDELSNFIFTEQVPKRSDIIFIPGGSYGEIAEHAASLYHQNLAPVILVSGKFSILEGTFPGPSSPVSYQNRSFATECDFLCQILLDHGVPDSAILREREAAYTYENAVFSKALTDQKNMHIQKAILSCQAYHARRALLYYQLLYPDTVFYVSPAVTRQISRDNWHLDPAKIDMVLGEVERCGSQFHEILKNRLSRDIL